MLTSDQEALARFVYKVYATGNTYGAPASAVKKAYEIIQELDLQCSEPVLSSRKEFDVKFNKWVKSN
jgi:hypothetical protein